MVVGGGEEKAWNSWAESAGGRDRGRAGRWGRGWQDGKRKRRRAGGLLTGSSEAAAGWSGGLTSCASADLSPHVSTSSSSLNSTSLPPTSQNPHPNVGRNTRRDTHAAICQEEVGCSLDRSVMVLRHSQPLPKQRRWRHGTVLNQTSSSKPPLTLQNQGQVLWTDQYSL